MTWRAENIDSDSLAALRRMWDSAMEELNRRFVVAELERDIKEPPRSSTAGGGSPSMMRFDKDSLDADAYLRAVLGREDAR